MPGPTATQPHNGRSGTRVEWGMENHPHGWLEVVCGPMFGGKSEELIRRLRRATIAKQKVMVFKPDIDTRYSVTNVASHNRTEFPAVPIPTGTEEHIYLEIQNENVQVVGIDEAQFFSSEIIDVCKTLANKGIRVIVAGLNQTSDGRPFGPMAELMASADEVTVLTAICTECGAPATKSQRLAASNQTVEVGSGDKYAARCRSHFVPG